mgnify:CR=1 FL=1|tara:strand:+ start:1400 stop:2083 length:684 start_codon:yes stop_codon:yes gene_type:complete
MKNKKFIMKKWIIVMLFLWISISSIIGQESFNSFYFKEPQPVDNKSSKKFPKKIQGSYFKHNDSIVQIIIEPESIYTTFAIVMPISNKEVQKSHNFYTKDSLFYGIKENEGIPYKELNDTTYAFLIQKDLLFKIDSINVLKKFGDDYFINERKSNGYYSTTRIHKNDTLLEIYEIDPSAKDFPIKALKYFSSEKIDDINTLIAFPTNEDFKNFIDLNGFVDTTKYHL